MINEQNRWYAFTLAEVLITLGIIGVVAAMTIPTLVGNYQKTQYIAQLKKAYSMFNQALDELEQEQGCINDLACLGIFDGSATRQQVGDILSKNFKIMKNCGLTGTGGCMPTKANSNYDGSGAFSDYNLSEYYAFINADGASFRLGIPDTHGCSYASVSRSGIVSHICSSVVIDVNGPNKGPNYMGRDIFYFNLTKERGLFPFGLENSTYWKVNGCRDINSPSARNGMYCAGRIMEEGWQMNY